MKRATLVYRGEEYDVKAGQTIRDAILKCGLLPETVIPVREGEMVTDENLLDEGDRVELVAVISGG